MVVFTENNITFYVNYNHILYRVENKNSEPKDVFIPSVLPDGTKIKGIERDFAVGEFGSISIDDGISLSYALGGPFSNMHAERLVWPQGITNITPYTFSNSVIGEISNLAHVDSVDYRAFFEANIGNMRWPDACTFIPDCCFESSTIGHLSNIDHVTRVGASAFKNTRIYELRWPDRCRIIPISCFQGSTLRHITNLDGVELIQESAFLNAEHIEKIDLSGTFVCKIEPIAFRGVDPNKVNLPYYGNLTKDNCAPLF